MKEDLYRIVQENLSEIFENASINDNSRFIEDLGFESVTMMQLIIEVEDFFKINFDNVDFDNVSTVGKMYEYIIKKINGKE